MKKYLVTAAIAVVTVAVVARVKPDILLGVDKDKFDKALK